MSTKNEQLLKIGIDPGWKNLAIAVVQDSVLTTKVFNPSKAITLKDAVDAILEIIPTHLRGTVVLERYVAYAGVTNADSEYILMLIGALVDRLQGLGFNVKLTRAIDWKPRLCKELFKLKGFRNPSEKFDKKFSIAAAESIYPEYKFKTDHEADAACLAYFA